MTNGMAMPNDQVRALTVPGETSATAAAAQAKALTEARYTMAMYNRRDWDSVRQELLKECGRPSFAHNKSAYYKKPIGAGVEGLGIRFTEVAMRCMRNVLTDTITVYEDDLKRILRVYVTDLESNNSYTKDVTISKTVERSKPIDDGSKDGLFLSVRVNSAGKKTYTVPATDDDLLNKEGALVSKTIRTLALRLIPGDLQDEAIATIKAIRRNQDAKDPAAARKAIADAFEEVGVSVAMLTDYLGHPLAQTTPTQMEELRGLFAALREGETTWKTIVEAQLERKASKGSTPTPPGPTEASGPQSKSANSAKAAEPRQETAAELKGGQNEAPPFDLGDAPETTPPPGKAAAPGPVVLVSAGQVRLLRAKLKSQDKVSESALCADYGVAKLEDLPASMFDSAKATLSG